MKKLIIAIILLIASNVIFAQTYMETAKYNYANYDTVRTAPDTLSRVISKTSNNLGLTFRYWYQVIIVPDSAIEVSTSISFPTNDTWLIRAGESWTSPKFDPYIVNLYWKRYNGTGACIVRKELFGY